MSKYVGLLTAAGLACLPMMASAAAPNLTEVLGASGVTLDGYVSGGYTYGFNDGRVLGGHVFDAVTDSFDLNQAAFTLAKLPAQGAGAAINVIAGEDAKLLNAAYGDASPGDADNINVTQAYLQYATGGLTIMGGRFVTLAGAEVINDTANANISRGFLFAVAQPLVHTGVRASYKTGGTTLYGGLSNAAFTVAGSPDIDTQKTVELGAAFAPSSASSLAVTGYYSPDNGGATDTDWLLDVVYSLQASDMTQFVLNADYRTSDFGTSDDQVIWGLAAYGNFKLSDANRLSLRAEYLDVSDAAGVAGADNDVQSVTLTLGHKVVANLELLGEVRWDMSDNDIFPDGATFEDSQGDVAVKAIYKF
ncbi:hypothetical protein D0B54_22400 [Solimonas sp. K1W22B-7]|uniref:outer membrane beta-barrel protein n=1 Tax=Solimonas sp. K1W22B-7 TaxID=2303331 RepID=UPI000E33311D|nr:outer membrane beta-barrel protein [Solimonas sp. K1W22B-7]AXQ31264.1 hypothetical protein D0B54_22400 [Solimonas sp. K1W22B-7]